MDGDPQAVPHGRHMTAGTTTVAPTFEDVLAARRFLEPYLRPSPLVERPAVSEALGVDVRLKCECLLPTGAFKVRGGLNLVGRDPTAKDGVIAASTGNHGQSLAYAGKVFAVPVTIVVPREANPLKVAAMRASGARIIEHGRDFDDARVECERLARAQGVRYVHSGNEPFLIAGLGTAALEVLLEWPEADVLIVPLGGGSGASGACIVAKAMNPRIKVIAVQSEGAPAAFQTWRDRAPRETERIATFAEGLATRTSFSLPQQILRELLDDFVLVSDDELYAAMRLLLVEGHVVAEGAGAAAVAAARRYRDRFAGKRVVCWVSGGNATAAQLERALASHD
jgi:threonine dehydratase